MTMMAQAPTARPALGRRAAEPEPAELRHRRVRLSTGSAAAAHAAGHVRAAIAEWRVPVDQGVAGILASDLIINAVTHATARRRRNGAAARRALAAEAVLLVIAADGAGLRVDVHDGSGDLPVLADCPAEADAETGRGLLLVTSLSAEWGFYRTPGGKAVYFTLQAQPDVHGNVIGAPHGHDPRSVT